jgi:hypothetical protein
MRALILVLVACASPPKPAAKPREVDASCPEARLRAFAARLGIHAPRILVESPEFLVHSVDCTTPEPDSACAERVLVEFPPPRDYRVLRNKIWRDGTERAGIAVYGTPKQIRYVELAWLREGHWQPGERDRVKRIASEERMHVVINGITHGLRIRATCL